MRACAGILRACKYVTSYYHSKHVVLVNFDEGHRHAGLRPHCTIIGAGFQHNFAQPTNLCWYSAGTVHCTACSSEIGTLTSLIKLMHNTCMLLGPGLAPRFLLIKQVLVEENVFKPLIFKVVAMWRLVGLAKLCGHNFWHPFG